MKCDPKTLWILALLVTSFGSADLRAASPSVAGDSCVQGVEEKFLVPGGVLDGAPLMSVVAPELTGGWSVEPPLSEVLPLESCTYIMRVVRTEAGSAAEEPVVPGQMVGTLQSVKKRLLEALPEGTSKNALKKYIEVLGLDDYRTDVEVANSNPGLERYYQKLGLKNPCLGTRAAGFYRELAALEAKRPSRGRNTFGLDEKAGKGEFADLKPGWAWDLALKHGGGNPAAAMTILGMCGHDDVHKWNPTITDVSPVGQSLREKQIEMLTRKLKDGKSNPETLKQELICVQGQPGFVRELDCPKKGTVLQLPGSLSPSLELPEGLKRKIRQIHGKGDPGYDPSAKHYHFYAAATLGCALAQEGVGPWVAGQVQRQFARAYRAVRLCENVRRGEAFVPAIRAFARELSKASVLTPGVFAQSEFRKAAVGAVLKAREELDCSGGDAEKPVCELTRALLGFGQEFGGAEALGKIYDRALLASETKEVYERWYLGGKTLGVNLPCSDVRVGGPERLEVRGNRAFQSVSSPCGIGYSVEKCKKIMQSLSEWELDAEWTMYQHEQGARFGATRCLGARLDSVSSCSRQ